MLALKKRTQPSGSHASKTIGWTATGLMVAAYLFVAAWVAASGLLKVGDTRYLS